MKKAILISAFISSVVFGATFDDAMAAYKAKDYAKSASIFEGVCNKEKNGVACFNAAYFNMNGMGVAKNESKAVDLYTKSCDAGNAGACDALATIYEAGKVVKKDMKKAVPLFEKGCKIGSGDSCLSMAIFYQSGAEGVAKNAASSDNYLQKACELNNAAGCYYYGVNRFNGVDGVNGGAREMNVGFFYMDRGCVLGFSPACGNVMNRMVDNLVTFK